MAGTFYAKGQPLADSILRVTKGVDSVKIKEYLRVAASIQNKDYPNCIRLCNEAILLAKEMQDTASEADAIFLKGLTSYFAGEYEQTLSFYLDAIKKFEAAHKPVGKAKVLNELGIFYRRQKQDSLSDASFKEAYHLAEGAAELAVMGTAINNQGITAQDKGAHDRAIDLFRQAQQIYVQVGDSIGVSYTLDYASVSEAAKGNYALADQLQQDAYRIRLRLGDSNAAALSLINLAEYAKLQKKYALSEKYLFDCLSITQKIAYKDLTAYCYKTLAELCSQTGRAELAYQYHVQYANLNEEIFNEKRSRQINELQTKYDTEKRLAQIELLTRENQLKEARNRTILVVFSALLLILLIGAYAYSSRLKGKKQKELDQAIIREKELRNRSIIEAEEKERVRIARDLHDGVAQTMTAAKMQLEYFMGTLGNSLPGDASLQNAFDLIQDAAKEVRTVSHSMVPNALLKSGLVAAVRDFVQRTGNEKLKINLVVLGLNERLGEQVETVVFRVLQELVNNILKHAQATEITIQLLREETELSVMVEDNGRGFDAGRLDEKAGMGLQNIESRIAYLNGQLHIDSSPGRGTTVMIEIPV